MNDKCVCEKGQGRVEAGDYSEGLHCLTCKVKKIGTRKERASCVFWMSGWGERKRREREFAHRFLRVTSKAIHVRIKWKRK